MIRSVRDRRIRIYSFFSSGKVMNKVEKFIFDLKQLRVRRELVILVSGGFHLLQKLLVTKAASVGL